MSEKSAIALCSLCIAVLAVPLLVAIQSLSTLIWSGTMVFALINGKGLIEEEDEL
jgi:hypothetical protein